MAELKKYLDIDVYEMAKNRIRHVINTFDSVLVAFSGGKDSLTVLHLVQEVYNEMGITEKVKVFFRDEELIPDNVIEFVQKIAESGKYDFRYYAIPLKSTKFILSRTFEYIQFDPNRKWLRNPPEYAITVSDGTVFSQYDADEFICSKEKGRVAIINGIRADESLIRLRSCINKFNENYINATQNKRIKLVKPIYDWKTEDVFLYFLKNDIQYCPIYDEELFNGDNFRVSTPLHAESAKKFNKLRTLNPVFYQQLIDLFPEMLIQDKYWSEYERPDFDSDKYEHSEKGLYDYIREEIKDPKQAALARKRISEALVNRQNKIAAGQVYNLGGYPLRLLFNCLVTGQYKRVLQAKPKATLQDFLFEGYTKEQYAEFQKN